MSGGALYPEWPYAAIYSISDTPSVDDYAIRITVAYAAGMNADFSDLRFRAGDSTATACPYFLEKKTDGTSAVVWVGIAAGQTSLVMLYGNAFAASESDAASTFPLLFDTFTALDEEVWFNQGGGLSIAGVGLMITGAAGWGRGINSYATFGLGHAVVANVAAIPSSGASWVGFAGPGVTTAAAYRRTSTNAAAVVANETDATIDIFTAPTSGYHVIEACRASAALMRVRVDGAEMGECTTNVPTDDLPAVVLDWYDDGGAVGVDWIAVRPCQAVEPTVTYVATGANPYRAKLGLAPYPEWPYAIDYSISPVPTVDNYLTRLTVRWRPGMRLDFRDLRFRDGDLGKCPYWIESKTDGVTADVWVRLRLGQGELSLLYGNGIASSESDWEDVWDYLEEFPTLDGDNWTDLGGVTVTSPGLTITGAAGGDRGIRSTATYGIGNAVVMRLRTEMQDAGSVQAGFIDATVENYALYRIGSSTLAYAESRAGSGTADADSFLAVRLPSGTYHTIEVCRLSTASVSVRVDGAEMGECTTNVPAGALPITVQEWYDTGWTGVDWIAVRPCQAVEPVLSSGHADLNPWSFLALRSRAPYVTPPSAWIAQNVVSYTVRRSIADSLYQASVTIEGLVPSGTDFKRVSLIEPDHNGVPRRIFFGFLPAQTSRLDLAANQTTYQGWDYGFYAASRARPSGMSVMPSATDPGTALRTYFADTDQWPAVLAQFDTSNIHTVAAWGSAAMPAREFTFTNKTSVMSVGNSIAEQIGWIWCSKWLDAGTIPTYDHQDPAHRIIRREAEDYDAGGEGVAYHDTTAGNTGGAYRADDVDIEFNAVEQGFNVGWIRDGEWLQYTVDLPVAGAWTVSFRVAAPLTGRWFDVYRDATLLERVSVPATGSYDTFVWTTPIDVGVAVEGDHVLKLVFGGAGSGSNEHMNLAAIDFYPPPAESPTSENIVPALYFVDEADIDDAADGLDLPPMAVIEAYDLTLAGPVTYQENFGSVANAVVLYYRTPTAPDTLAVAPAWDLWTRLEGWIDHVEEAQAPITDAVASDLAQALLDYYSMAWGTITASFVRRPDLQLWQKIKFVGHEGVPETEFRITEISYSAGLAKCDVQITAIPAHKYSIERQLQRALKPDPATEIESVVKSVLAQQAAIVTGTVASVGTGTVAVTLDRGGTLTARGVAISGDRVVCIPTEGVGYVATVIDPA